MLKRPVFGTWLESSAPSLPSISRPPRHSRTIISAHSYPIYSSVCMPAGRRVRSAYVVGSSRVPHSRERSPETPQEFSSLSPRISDYREPSPLPNSVYDDGEDEAFDADSLKGGESSGGETSSEAR